MSYQPNEVGEEQWDDFVPHFWNVPSGGSSPDLETMPGFTILSQWAFDGQNTTEILESQFEVMHDFKEGTNIYPHVHWSPSTADAGNVKWFVIYSYANGDEEFSEEVTLSVIDSADGLGANGRALHHVVEFPPISDPNIKIGAQIRLAIRRVPSDAEDTYSDDAFMHQVGLHYQNDTRGSRSRFVK
jgi:hypothetical protein